MEKANNSSDRTTESFSSIDVEMTNRTKLRKIKRIVCFFCAMSLSLFLVLFLSLPCFQLKGMTVEGLVNFEKQDVLSLTGYGEGRLNLLLDADKASENIVSSSGGLISSCKIENNGIVSSCTIKEDYPVCKYRDVAYLSSGKSISEALDDISSLSVSDESKERIRENFNKEENLVLPTIHLPLNVTDDLEHAKMTFSSLSGIPLVSLRTFVGIQFENSSGDTNYGNVCKILLQDNGSYYLIEKVLSDYISPFFSNSQYPEGVFMNLRSKINESSSSAIARTDFHFEGETKTYDAYRFQLSRSENGEKLMLSAIREQ